MTELIRTTDELPPWFKIENYQKVAELSEAELAKELGRRNLILDAGNLQRQVALFFDIEDYTLVANFPKFEPGMTPEQWLSLFRSTEAMPKHDVAGGNDNDEIEFLSSWKVPRRTFFETDAYRRKMGTLAEKSKLKGLNGEFVRPTTLFDVLRILRHSEKEGQYRSDVDYEFFRPDDLKKDDVAQNRVLLTIDLSSKDQVIKDEFAKILPVLREHTGVKGPSKVVDDYNIGRIVQFNVIAYIDLWLWGKLYGKRVIDSVAANALFKDGRYGENKIKTTIRPLALAALEYPFISTLRKRQENLQEKTN